MLLLKYDLKEILVIDTKIKDCCDPANNPPDTSSGSSDCCFDEWTKELKSYNSKHSAADKLVTTLNTRLTHIGNQRDMWKAWRDELDKVCEASKSICHQLDVLLHHVTRTDQNIDQTYRAIKLLYCMIKDFFIQIDCLKTSYDYLVTCIKSGNNPVLVPGQGVMLLIEDYGKKLDAVIATRDGLIEAIIKSISLINSIHKSVGHKDHKYGLNFILQEWKTAFSCDGKKDDDEPKWIDYYQESTPRPEGEFENIGLEPMFRFPVCESWYYKKIVRKYGEDNEEYTKLSKTVKEETKKLESLKALIDGLNSVISDPNVDPAKRCAPAAK